MGVVRNLVWIGPRCIIYIYIYTYRKTTYFDHLHLDLGGVGDKHHAPFKVSCSRALAGNLTLKHGDMLLQFLRLPQTAELLKPSDFCSLKTYRPPNQ